MKNPYFGRLLTAMVTPFNADGSVNYENAADLAEWLIAHGSNGLVVAGSTGEAATMTVDEKLELFRVVVNRVNKRVPVIAGTGCNCTAETVKMTKMAEVMGIDGVLIVGPYYNKPTQEGSTSILRLLPNLPSCLSSFTMCPGARLPILRRQLWHAWRKILTTLLPLKRQQAM